MKKRRTDGGSASRARKRKAAAAVAGTVAEQTHRSQSGGARGERGAIDAAEPFDSIHAALRDHFVFCAMEEAVMSGLVASMEPRTFDRGQSIITQGDQGDTFFVMTEGEVDVEMDGRVVASLRGPARVRVDPPFMSPLQASFLDAGVRTHGDAAGSALQQTGAQFGPTRPTDRPTVLRLVRTTPFLRWGRPTTFGELALMYDCPRTASIIVRSASCRCWCLSESQFRRALEPHPAARALAANALKTKVRVPDE